MEAASAFVSRATLKAAVTNPDSKRHVAKYLTPFLPNQPHHAIGTHTLNRNVGDYDAGSLLTIIDHSIDDKRHYATVQVVGARSEITIPVSWIQKPGSYVNGGLSFESELVEHLNRHGLMTGGGAGCTNGNDFHLHGDGVVLNGEAKQSVRKAAFGQVTLHYDLEKGWHIGEKAASKYRCYARTVETATAGGRSLLQRLNSEFGPLDRTKDRSSRNVYSDDTSLVPMAAYLLDHDVDVLHVGSHGTLRSGRNSGSQLDLPWAIGVGYFRVRNKHPGTLTAQFKVREMNTSPIDISTDDGAEFIKERLVA
jgi:hypothetical protein